MDDYNQMFKADFVDKEQEQEEKKKREKERQDKKKKEKDKKKAKQRLWKPWEVALEEELIYYKEKVEGHEKRNAIGMKERSPNTKRLRKVLNQKKVIYQGEKQNGLRAGKGICGWPIPPHGSGDRYWGEWAEDRLHGMGIYCWFQGDSFIGEWAAGLMHGMGVYKYAARGPNSNEKFSGAYRDGKKYGYGLYEYPKGDTYAGQWKNGLMDGYGVFVHSDGDKYEGEWKNDKKNGVGVYEWGSGRLQGTKYEGEFSNDHRHGYGVMVDARGGKYRGCFEHGHMHGNGVFVSSDGHCYYGEWKKGYKHGECVYEYAFGGERSKTKYTELWQYGELIKRREVQAEDWVNLQAPALYASDHARVASETARSLILRARKAAKRWGIPLCTSFFQRECQCAAPCWLPL